MENADGRKIEVSQGLHNHFHVPSDEQWGMGGMVGVMGVAVCAVASGVWGKVGCSCCSSYISLL